MRTVTIKCRYCDKIIQKQYDGEKWLSGLAGMMPYFQLVFHNMKHHKDKKSVLYRSFVALIPLSGEAILYLLRVLLTCVCWPFVLLAHKLKIADIDI